MCYTASRAQRWGVVRHVACDDLNEGSFAITPYDEDGATAVAVASVVLTEDGKRRRVSVSSVDRGASSPSELVQS